MGFDFFNNGAASCECHSESALAFCQINMFPEAVFRNAKIVAPASHVELGSHLVFANGATHFTS